MKPWNVLGKISVTCDNGKMSMGLAAPLKQSTLLQVQGTRKQRFRICSFSSVRLVTSVKLCIQFSFLGLIVHRRQLSFAPVLKISHSPASHPRSSTPTPRFPCSSHWR